MNISTSNMDPMVKEYLDKVVIRDGQKWIDDDIHISGSHIEELPFHNINVNGHFHASFNHLRSLKGSPIFVSGDFICYSNRIESLEGSPSYVGGQMDIGNNRLKNLKGAPFRIRNDFLVGDNMLESLEGFPSYVGGDVDLNDNPELKSLKEINEVSGYIYLNHKIDCDYLIQFTLMGKILLTLK